RSTSMILRSLPRLCCPQTRSTSMRTFGVTLAVIAVAALVWRPSPMAATPPENDVRGGWIADVDGHRLIYVLKVRDGRISGIYCADCSSPDGVAFLQDGKIEGAGITFRVRHVAGPNAPYSEMVRGRLENGRLVLTSTREGASDAGATVTSLTREPRRTRNGLSWPADQLAAARTARHASSGRNADPRRNLRSLRQPFYGVAHRQRRDQRSGRHAYLQHRPRRHGVSGDDVRRAVQHRSDGNRVQDRNAS